MLVGKGTAIPFRQAPYGRGRSKGPAGRSRQKSSLFGRPSFWPVWAVRGNGRDAHTVRATAGKFAHAPGGTVGQASRRSASPAGRNSDSWARRVCRRTSPPPVDSGTRLAVSPRTWTRRGVRPGRRRQDPAALRHRRGRPEVPQVGEKTSSRRGGKGQLTQVSHGGVDRRAAGRGLPLMALRTGAWSLERFSRDAISCETKQAPCPAEKNRVPREFSLGYTRWLIGQSQVILGTFENC